MAKPAIVLKWQLTKSKVNCSNPSVDPVAVDLLILRSTVDKVIQQ